MERARELRENAARCIRLSRSINSPADVAWLEDLAAEAAHAADRLEAEEPDIDAEADPSWHLTSAHDSVRILEDRLFPDRRRSGRQDVSNVLIPLLRSESLSGLPVDPGDDGPDQLNASRGIIIWTLVSAIMWVPLLWWML